MIESKEAWADWGEYNQHYIKRDNERAQLNKELAAINKQYADKTIDDYTANFMLYILRMRIALFQVVYYTPTSKEAA